MRRPHDLCPLGLVGKRAANGTGQPQTVVAGGWAFPEANSTAQLPSEIVG